MTRVLGSFLVLLLCACGPALEDEPLACRNTEPGTVSVGLGDLSSGFVEASDGDDISILLGPQGMHMLIVSLRTRNLEMPAAGAGVNRITIGVSQHGELIGGTVADVPPSATSGATVDFLGLRPVFTADEFESVLSEITANISDGCGREITAEKQLRLVQ